MKNLLTLTTLLAALTACKEKDKNEPMIPDRAVISGASTNTYPEATVTLTAFATDAEYYVWKKNDTVIPNETESTLVVKSDGYYPFDGNYSAAGVSAAGTGFFSVSHFVELTPVAAPTDPKIEGETVNVCPIRAARLTAKVKNATSYIWYYEGEVVLRGGDTVNTRVLNATRTGNYTVTGVNPFGKTGQSAVHTVTELVECPFQMDTTWLVEGISWYEQKDVAWNETIIKKERNDTTFYEFTNFYGMGHVFEHGAPIIIYEDEDGEYYMPTGVFVFELEETGRRIHQYVGGAVYRNGPGGEPHSIMYLSGRARLEISVDGTMFRFPPRADDPTHGKILLGVGYGAIFPPEVTPGWIAATDLVADPIFTVTATSANRSQVAPNPNDIEWVRSRKPCTLSNPVGIKN